MVTRSFFKKLEKMDLPVNANHKLNDILQNAKNLIIGQKRKFILNSSNFSGVLPLWEVLYIELKMFQNRCFLWVFS